jgi:hypothetical protein
LKYDYLGEKVLVFCTLQVDLCDNYFRLSCVGAMAYRFVFWMQVQNADDNSYGPGVEAALVFIVQSGHIVVFNNEDGFTPANLRALCDVGNSTKAGSSTGYIGHKYFGYDQLNP